MEAISSFLCLSREPSTPPLSSSVSPTSIIAVSLTRVHKSPIDRCRSLLPIIGLAGLAWIRRDWPGFHPLKSIIDSVILHKGSEAPQVLPQFSALDTKADAWQRAAVVHRLISRAAMPGDHHLAAGWL
jgi:hypothetical protein